MTAEPLHLIRFAVYPKNPYNPRHSRATYFDTDSRTFIARACIGAEVIVEVESDKDYTADMALSSRLNDIFRALRAAA